MFGTDCGKLVMEVVGRLQMLFLDFANGFLEWHQLRTESVIGVTMALVTPATAS